MKCDRHGCDVPARWFIGEQRPFGFAKGHAACMEHTGEGIGVTYVQLRAEGGSPLVTVMPIELVDEDSRQPKPGYYSGA